MKFEDLPIIFDEQEVKDGWRRDVQREGTVAELLDIWDIDDPTEDCAMAQVLRHLREAIGKNLVAHGETKTGSHTLGDYDRWYQTCTNCGFEPGQQDSDKCWRCGKPLRRDFSVRALKSNRRIKF